MHAAVGGKELRALRKSLGMTLAQLADGIVTVGFLSAVETGQKLIHRDKLALLMARLEAAAEAVPDSERPTRARSLHARLRLAISKGQRDEARALRDQLRAESVGDEPALMLAEGQFEATFGDPLSAYQFLSAAVWRLPRASEDWFRAVIDYCQICTEVGKESEAGALGMQAVAMVGSIGLDPDLELELRATVAGPLCNVGDPHAALEVLQAPAAVLAAASDWGRVTLLWAEANAMQDIGEIDKAAARSSEALELLRPLRRELTTARLKNVVASFEIQRQAPDWHLAERLLHEAAETHRRLGSFVDLGQTLGTTGDMWARRGEHAAAEAAFDEALAAVPDAAGAIKACVLLELATAQLRAGATSAAREQLQAAQRLLDSEASSRYHLQLWHRLALMFEQQGDLPAAMLCIKEAAR